MPNGEKEQIELLKVFTSPSGYTKPADEIESGVSLSRLQKRLEPHSTLIAYLDGGEFGALLAIMPNSAKVTLTPALRELTDLADQFALLAGNLTVPVAEIDAAGDRLAAALFGPLGLPEAPKHLILLDTAPFDRIPIGAIRWPGSNAPLVSSSSITIAVGLPVRDSDEPRPGGGGLTIIAPDGNSGHPVDLPPLANAAAARSIIEGALAGTGIEISSAPNATREALLRALRRPQSWVHVAAHGVAQPGRIGGAGVWLSADQGHTGPEFVSWLDVLGHSVAANLIVLDACELGASPEDAYRVGSSFAKALAGSGARSVVAAMWPVSDAASAVWIREFYARLLDTPEHDPAVALGAAQRRLMTSRAFRHPFYWASLAHFARL
jgi:hypothetical protein